MQKVAGITKASKSLSASRVFIFLGCCILLIYCNPVLSKDRGWVPMEHGKDIKVSKIPKSSGKTHSKKDSTPSIDTASKSRKKGLTVYEDQSPITEKELKNFLEVMPKFRKWTRQNKEIAHPVVTEAGKPDFTYSPKSAQWITANGFDPARFFCIMGKMAAAIAVLEEGNDFNGHPPNDMPKVAPQELNLCRKYMGELLTAGGVGQ